MDIFELLGSTRLIDVRSIHREASLELDPSEGNGLSELGELEPAEIAIEVNPVTWGTRIETWFRIVLESKDFHIIAAVAVLYDRESDEEIPESVRVEFVEKVAVMAAYPYLRADVQSLAADLRVGNLTLPVLQQGEFKITPSADLPDIEAEDNQ